MKVTQVLLKQHIGWHFIKHWHQQARVKPSKTDALKILQSKGIRVYEPEDILNEKRTFEKVEIIGFKEKPVVFDETHPDWHEECLLQYKDDNVLLEGIKQAKVLTNTVELQEGLPQGIKLVDIPQELDKQAKRIIRNCQMFDAEQKKLPKIKDPVRYFFNFPRVYGITQDRRNTLITTKLLQLIESSSDQYLHQDRYLFRDLLFSFPFKRLNKQIQFQLTGDFLLSSSKLLNAATQESTVNFQVPDISPLDPTISIMKNNIYKVEHIYPINPGVKKRHPHTLFIFLNKEQVKNEFEEPVSDDQVFGRSLLKSFTVAASYAVQTYGIDVKALPEPVTIQCVQTDGQKFHFSVFQLNTLDLEDSTIKNVWFHIPFLNLFEKCGYNLGKPVLEGYNSLVLKHLHAFYHSI